MKKECVCPRARHQHGTRAAFTRDGCRCTPCGNASSAYHRARRARLSTSFVPRLGTVRRLQALAADGWSLNELGAHMHMTGGALWHLRDRRPADGMILRYVADHIAANYERLWHSSPTGRYQTYTTRHAEARGWAAPWQWDGLDINDPIIDARTFTDPDGTPLDEIAVVRIMAGTLTATSSPERTEAIRRLARQGLDDPEIADRLGLSSSAAGADRRRHGIPAGVPVNRTAKEAAA